MKIPKSKRARRVGVEIQKVVSDGLRRLMADQAPGVVVTVPEVRLSDDLKHAAVYCSIMGAEDEKAVQLMIRKAAPKMRKLAADALHIRSVPELRFVWDDTMERADRIEQLLNQIHNSSVPPTEDDRADS